VPCSSISILFISCATDRHLSVSIAYRQGVTTAITAPSHYGFLGGLSTAFSTGATHKLAKGAIVQDVAALHVAIDQSSAQPSVSTQIAVLRRLLLGESKGEVGKAFGDAAKVGEIVMFPTFQLVADVKTIRRASSPSS
jgi:hypothetical protein